MHLGELKFKKRSSKDDQATVEEDESGPAKQVGKLIGVDPDVLIDNFVQPKIKVGAEWVTKGQNVDQATNAVSAIGRALFEKLFRHLVDPDVLIDNFVQPKIKVGAEWVTKG